MGLLPLIVPDLRGEMNHRHCWVILLASEYLLAMIFIGTISILLVIVVYVSILVRALQKLNVMKRGSSASISTDAAAIPDSTSNQASTSVTQQSSQQVTISITEQSKKGSIFCCWKLSSDVNTAEANPSLDPELAKWKAIKIVCFTTGTIAFTMLPFFLVSLMYIYCDHEINPNYCDVLKKTVASPLTILLYLNSVLNPIIYVWWHSGFRTIRSMEFVRFIRARRRLRWNLYLTKHESLKKTKFMQL